jgi:adenylate cyclase
MKKLLAALLFAPALAHASFMSGNELLSRMNGEAHQQLHAIGYIQGVVDAYTDLFICPPNNITAGQVRDMIKNYLTNLPAQRHRPADILIREGLSSVWPCKQGNSGRGA